jgi:hypothetical protein
MTRRVQQVTWRVGQAKARWTQATEMVREAAATPGYCGPSVEQMEEVAAGIARVREAVLDWVWDQAQREARRVRPRDRAAVRRIVQVVAERQ